MTAQDLIKECRRRKGMTQRQLAEKAGLSYSMICFWEQGRHEPRFSAVVECLKVMGYEIVIREKKK